MGGDCLHLPLSRSHSGRIHAGVVGGRGSLAKDQENGMFGISHLSCEWTYKDYFVGRKTKILSITSLE